MELSVVGGQGVGQLTGGLVPGEALALAVHGQRDGRLGKALIHVVGDVGGEDAVLGGDRDGGHGLVGQLLIGGGELIQVEGADGLLPAAIDHGEGLERDGPLGQGGGDVLPAGEVQGGEDHLGGSAVGVGHGSGEGIAGAVPVDPQVQVAVTAGDGHGGAQRGGAGLTGAVIHPDAPLAVAHQVAGGLRIDGGVVRAGEVGQLLLALKAVQGLNVSGHGDRNGDIGPAGADSQVAGGALLPGGKEAVFIHRAHGGVHRPGVAGVLTGEGDLLPHGAGGEVHALHGGQGQRGDGRAGVLVGHRDGIRVLDHGDGGGALRLPGGGGDLGGAALAAGGKDAVHIHHAVPVLDGPGNRPLPGEGITVLVHRGGRQGHLGPREDHRVIGGHIVMVQLPVGLQLGDQEDAVADGAQAAVGGGVEDLHGVLVGQGGAEGGGAAAVQGHRLHAAQLNEPLGHLGEGSAHAVTGLPAVDGVEEHAAVGLDADGGAGVGVGIGLGTHLAVGDDLIVAADGGDHVLPAAVGGGDVDAHLVAGLQGGHLVQEPLVVLLVDGEDQLALGNGNGGVRGEDLVHGTHQTAAHGELVGEDQGAGDLLYVRRPLGEGFGLQALGVGGHVGLPAVADRRLRFVSGGLPLLRAAVGGRVLLRIGRVLLLPGGLPVGVGDLQVHVHRLAQVGGDGGEDHVIPRAGVLGGGAVLVGVEVEAALMGAVGGGAGLVHVGHPHGGAVEGGGDGQVGLSDEGGAVLQEAHGVVAAGGGAQDAVADDDPQGVAGGEVEEVAVDAAEHPEALVLQGLGHGGQILPGEELVAVDHHGVDAFGGGVGDVPLGAQVGLGVAPKDLLHKLGTRGQVDGAAVQLVAQGQGRGRGGGEPHQNSQGQRRGPDAKSFHSCLQKSSQGEGERGAQGARA